MRILIAFSLLILLGGAAVASDSDDAPQHFKQWQSHCRLDGYCLATTAAQAKAAGGTDTRYSLSIGRPAQQTYWEVSIHLAHADADLGRDFRSTVGNKTLTFSGPGEIAPYGDINHVYFLGAGAQSLLDKLVHGKSLNLSFTDRTGSPRDTTFLLAGLSAALIWIDTRQHRLGSERVAETPPYGLVRADLPGGIWMAPAIAATQ